MKQKVLSSRLPEILSILKKNDVVRGVNPEKLKLILEDLGPTFIKLGQIMSMRSDMLPQAYCDELKKLRSDVAPMGFEEFIQIIESEYGTEYHNIFNFIESKPIGSASIAQVHFARLKNGTNIVVKAQRSGIKETMSKDIGVLRKAIKVLNLVNNVYTETLDFNSIVEEMWTVAQEELDFLKEAQHLEEFYDRNSKLAYISCPQVIKELSTSKVLIMEYIDGIAIDHIDELLKHNYGLEEIGYKLADNYAKQILDDGIFHADPHPGNICIRGGQIVWLDLGMMGTLSAKDRRMFSTAVKSIVTNDIYELKNAIITFGVIRGKINHALLYDDIDMILAKYGSMEFSELDMGQVIMDINEVCYKHHIGVPKGVSMLGRGMLTIEGVLTGISPDINFIDILANHMSGLELIDLKSEIITTGMTMVKALKKTMDIPIQLSDIFKMTIKGQTKVNLELTGTEMPLSKIDQMMNRLIISIIISSLLIGSSLICTTDMSLKILGIPALGAIGYVTAAFLGLWLLIHIVKKG